eukprot:365295-Chlamydomonas_euryale.AAC.8
MAAAKSGGSARRLRGIRSTGGGRAHSEVTYSEGAEPDWTAGTMKIDEDVWEMDGWIADDDAREMGWMKWMDSR